MLLDVGDAVVEEIRALVFVTRPPWFLIVRAGEVEKETIVEIARWNGGHVPGPARPGVHLEVMAGHLHLGGLQQLLLQVLQVLGQVQQVLRLAVLAS